MCLETFIQEEARRLDFVAVGFVPVGPSKTFNRFQEWLTRGYAGDMDYLFRNAILRSHPSWVAPYAKTIIVVAARYPSVKHSEHWSNVALGKDYHDVLRSRLKQLEQAIRGQVSVPLLSRVCVDTAPLLEREWACRAGLGWIGRQGSLVHPEFGCCLFLGALLVNVGLNASPAVPNQCGDCHLCVEACPTGAIQADGFVDSRRCVAYLTIEHKDKIPDALRPLVGTAIFGCDRCTAVCPRNPLQEEGLLDEFKGSGFPRPTPEACLAMAEAEFDRRFAGTAVHRLGLERLKRNARNVLKLADS